MRYRIVRPEDLDRITLAVVEDASDPSVAIEKVPESTTLPAKVAVLCEDHTTTIVVVGPHEPIPSVVQRGVVAPAIPDPPAEEPEPPAEDEPPVPDEPAPSE